MPKIEETEYVNKAADSSEMVMYANLMTVIPQAANYHKLTVFKTAEVLINIVVTLYVRYTENMPRNLVMIRFDQLRQLMEDSYDNAIRKRDKTKLDG